uniref:deoxyribonuclease-1-like 1 isoform X2 n=1 Tax=Doryrhamphus excisus TaxID=161450 RepID=UPI0025AE9952|nr:deoxyribonuclease-1-like 1 isoform X2 [Doryrhamphus excisus]
MNFSNSVQYFKSTDVMDLLYSDQSYKHVYRHVTQQQQVIILHVFRGHALQCHPTEYLIEEQCCPKCLPGSHVRDDCTNISGTTCRACVKGTYMHVPTGQKKCFPCTICHAVSGLQIKKMCTTISDTECEPLEGFYCLDPVENGCQEARKHTDCLPGQYISQKGTALADTECSDCAGQSFSNGTLTTCQPHTNCESKKLHVITPGTASADAVCGESRNRTGIIFTCAFSFLCISAFLLCSYFRNKKQLT